MAVAFGLELALGAGLRVSAGVSLLVRIGTRIGAIVFVQTCVLRVYFPPSVSTTSRGIHFKVKILTT